MAAIPALDYPFCNDGLYYMGKLAHMLNAANLQEAFAIFSTLQGSLFFAFHLVVAKVFGLAYPLFWKSQILLYSAELSASLPRVKGPRWSAFSEYLGLLAFFLGGGMFTAYPANIFDFRLDLSASLLLLPALLSLARASRWAVLWIPLATFERFHNLTLIILALGLLCLLDIVQKRRLDLPTLISKLRIPLLAIAVALVIRWNYFVDFFDYYRSVQLSADSDYIVSWRSPGFFTFYAKVLLRDFLGLSGSLLFLGLISFLTWRHSRRFGFKSMLRELFDPKSLHGFFLLFSLASLLLLIANPTRNNPGVFRFAWMPALYGIFLFYQSTRQHFSTRAHYGILALLMAQGLFHGWSFYKNFEYFGIRKYRYSEQIKNIYNKAYARAEERGLETLHFASFYTLEYNFNAHQWQYFLAKEKLAPRKLVHLFGNNSRIHEAALEVDAKIGKVNFVAVPVEGCWLPYLPADATLKESLAKWKSSLDRHCPDRIGQVQLEACKIDVRECHMPGAHP
jgi:hypothetical protein